MMSVEQTAPAEHLWGERLTLVSSIREVRHASLLDTLRLAQGEARIYWKNDLLPVAYAGYGAAAKLIAEGQSRIARIQLQIDHLYEGAHLPGNAPREAAPRLFGGFAFGAHYAPDGIWSAFPSACFILPRVQFTQIDGRTWLTISQNVESDVSQRSTLRHLEQDANDVVDALAHLKLSPVLSASVEQIDYPLALDDWRRMITGATMRIHAGELNKVVLSRVCDVAFADPIDPVHVLENLGSRYPDCFRFLLEVEPGHAFIGATPELMAEVHDSNLHTMALAGSRKRGATTEEDDALAQEMMDSPKERHEHALVVEGLRERVRPYARTMDVPDAPTIYRLQNIQHLYTPVRAELETHFDVLDLVGELHPTPALGGTPRRAAVEAIEQLETEERGWYAAPVGWVDANGDGVFAVAIRSAVSAGNHARLYAGVGIVAESDPDKEWEETGWKFKPLLGALGVTDGST
jgi:menaquinone-specific isochorismate synthase